MSEFTIGEPTTEVPATFRTYGEVWEALKDLADDGSWLPITFAESIQARRFHITGRNLEVRRSDTTVYIRRKQ